jgi:transcriptional regulator with XRE-family HTH domain
MDPKQVFGFMERDGEPFIENAAPPLSFGSYLRNVRLERGISLEEVSYETRISLEQLLAIEQEATEYLPVQIYVTGFIKAYAKIIGADPDQALQLYKQDLRTRQPEAKIEIAREGPDLGFWLRLGIVLLVMALIGALSYFLLPKLLSQASLENTVSQENVTDAATQDYKETDAPPPAVTGADLKSTNLSDSSSGSVPNTDSEPAGLEASNTISKFAANGDRVENEPRLRGNIAKKRYVLKIQAHEETWLKIIIDNQTPAEFHLKVGDHLELPANSGYNILVGNAAGIDLRLNNRSVPVSGKSGQVVTLQLP